MSWPVIADVPRLTWLAAGRIVNGVAEGTVLAAGAWMLLRVLRRPSASTRFAVWFTVMLVVAAFPLLGALLVKGFPTGSASSPSLIRLPLSWAVCGLATWAALAAMGLARLGLGFRQLRRLREDCEVVDLSRLDARLRKTLEQFHHVRPVELRAAEGIKVPTAIGFFRPAVILPAWTLRELSADELHSVVLHELAHLRRWDDWTTLVQESLRALLCLHPAMWWIAGRLSLEREMACDDLVVAETANPRAYAQCLVSLAEKSFLRRGVALAQAAVSRMRPTSLRVARILDSRPRHTTLGWKPAVALVGVLSAACLAVLARTPQLVSFGSNVPAVRMETAAGTLPATAQPPSAADRKIAGFPATVVPTIWRPKGSSTPPVQSLRRHSAAASGKHPSNTLLAHAHPPTVNTRLGFVVDLRPEMVLFVMGPGNAAGQTTQIWRIDVYELTIFSSASHAGRQLVFAKI